MKMIESARSNIGNTWINLFESDRGELLVTATKSYLDSKTKEWKHTPFIPYKEFEEAFANFKRKIADGIKICFGEGIQDIYEDRLCVSCGRNKVDEDASPGHCLRCDEIRFESAVDAASEMEVI